MDGVFRLLLRLILVPLGYLAAVAAGVAVIVIGEWRIGALIDTPRPDEAALGIFVAIVATTFVLVVLVSGLWLVAAVGILFSEMFAVRSWMFHAANGVVSAWIGAQLLAGGADAPPAAADPLYVVAAGLAGGLVYWLVAGSTAGFHKPVLRPAAERARSAARPPAGPGPSPPEPSPPDPSPPDLPPPEPR